MAALCRYGDLVLAASLLATAEPDEVECDEFAEYTAIIATDNDGFVIEIRTPVCPVHEAHVSQNLRHVRSIKLRQPAADPPAMCESPSAHDLCDHD